MGEVKRYYALAFELHEHGPFCGDRCTAMVSATDYDLLREKLREARKLMEDFAQHFESLRKEGIYFWPNHPLNPEKRIADFLKGAP